MMKNVFYFIKRHVSHVILGPTFPQLIALGPRPWPPAPFTFLRSQVQITFSRPLTMELLFHAPPLPQHQKLLVHGP